MSILDLPLDLLVGILLRLPVKSLLRCKCVCKHFNLIIEDCSFVNRHLNYRIADGRNSFLLSANSGNANSAHHILSFTETNVLSSLSRIHSNFITSKLSIIGSSNGLVCVNIMDNNRSSILLWNPTTSLYKILPIPQIYDRMSLGVQSVLEFGFAKNGNDYKVIKSVFYVRIPQNLYTLQIEVYKLKTNTWTIIEGKKPCYVKNSVSMEFDPILPLKICSSFCPVLLKGAFNWIAEDPREDLDDPCLAIVSFDLNDEQLRLVTVLNSDQFPIHGNRLLTVIDESLTLVLSQSDGLIRDGFEIWMMSEYGVKDSWTKRFRVERFPLPTYPVGYWKDGLMIMHEYPIIKKGSLFFYDLISRERKDFIDLNHNVKNLYYYVETLVSVNGGNEVAGVANLQA